MFKTIKICFLTSSLILILLGIIVVDIAFTATIYADGALVKAIGKPEVYVIQNGKKCYIPDMETFNAKDYHLSAIKEISLSDLNNIQTGMPILSVRQTLSAPTSIVHAPSAKPESQPLSPPPVASAPLHASGQAQVKAIKITPEKAIVFIKPGGAKVIFKAEAKDQGNKIINVPVRWTIGNSRKGTIDANGTFTPKEMGSTTVTASVGSISSAAKVVVSCAGGWASQLHCGTETDVQRKIVELANMARDPGLSTTRGTWKTDVADGDGDKMIKAISIYDQWKRSKDPRKATLDKVKDEMIKAFFGSKYETAQKNQLVAKILSVYEKNKNIPRDDESTLRYLEIKKQCLEWAMTIAQSAGGKPKNYHTTGTVAPKDVRPGMGYYNPPLPHAMIIIDVKYDNDGNPVNFRVAESNNGSGWVNPKGQIPWMRTIGRGREENLGHTIVDYEK